MESVAILVRCRSWFVLGGGLATVTRYLEFIAAIATRAPDDYLPCIPTEAPLKLCLYLAICCLGRDVRMFRDRTGSFQATTDMSYTRPEPSLETQVRLVPIRRRPDSRRYASAPWLVLFTILV